MASAFSSQVNAWARKAERRMMAVMRESAQRLIDQAQTPVGAGGKMRVDTGFLRASGQPSLSGMPTGPSRREEGLGNFDVSLVIAQWQPGGTFWFGWTAEYALPRESVDGFMRSAAQNWQPIVAAVVREAMARYP